MAIQIQVTNGFLSFFDAQMFLSVIFGICIGLSNAWLCNLGRESTKKEKINVAQNNAILVELVKEKSCCVKLKFEGEIM